MTEKKQADTDWIAEIEFKQVNVRDIIEICRKCKTKEEASKLIECYRAYCVTPEAADENLGYIFGYCNEEERKKLYRLFPVSHPVFGADFGRVRGSEKK